MGRAAVPGHRRALSELPETGSGVHPRGTKKKILGHPSAFPDRTATRALPDPNGSRTPSATPSDLVVCQQIGARRLGSGDIGTLAARW